MKADGIKIAADLHAELQRLKGQRDILEDLLSRAYDVYEILRLPQGDEIWDAYNQYLADNPDAAERLREKALKEVPR